MLVVDDNGDSAESLALLLSLAGHETHVARDRPGGAAIAPTRCAPTRSCSTSACPA